MLGSIDPRSLHSYEVPTKASKRMRTRCVVRGVELCEMCEVQEKRGDLTVGEFSQDIPFAPARYFLVHNVPTSEVRGQHAHLICEQFMICINGSVTVTVDDGKAIDSFILGAPNVGLYIPAGVWGAQSNFSPGCMLLVFASHHYDALDYVRSYDHFIAEVARENGRLAS